MVWSARKETKRKPQADDPRSAFDADYSRVVHSASFRRLQRKTQTLNLGDSDFYRTRMTHSLEVAQIATGIVRHFQKNHKDHSCISHLPEDNLINSICLTHDLGHPPFGHGGEVALNFCMRSHSGFEANGQTLRILSRLEKFSESNGANLTRRVLLGILKYPVPYSQLLGGIVPKLADGTAVTRILDREASKPPKCFLDTEQGIVDWILEPLCDEDRQRFTAFTKPTADKHGKALYKSLDCSIMDVADDIAYAVHDLEDAIALKLISREQFQSIVNKTNSAEFINQLETRYPSENYSYELILDRLFGNGDTRKREINHLVSYAMSSTEPAEDLDFQLPLLRYRAVLKKQAHEFIEALQKMIRKYIIRTPSVQHLEFKGQQMVLHVFDAMQADPAALLPQDTYDRYKAAENDPRIICDHISGMTDDFLVRTYDRLFSPRMGSVFDRL